MQLLVDTLCQATTDSLNLSQLIHARRHYTPKPAKARQQALSPFGSDALYIFQRRARARFATPLPVSLNRKAMRFVANLLDQM